MPPITFHAMIEQAARYLERNYRCPKHHVEHTGSIAYLLDFYDYLGEIEKGKKLVGRLLGLIVKSPEGAKVFYPGHINPMNMSQNVIDTGTAVDTIARFAHRNRLAFTDDEHKRIYAALAEVVETYLAEAARSKKITNQRLWGLTGLASYARYAGEESRYASLAHESIERAFKDMTVDGYFRYYPDPAPHLAPYDDITAFYQSRHTGFIEYALSVLGGRERFEGDLEQSRRALLSMYTANGFKDLRMECKRWYWLSPYEVASHSFDAYALAHSKDPHATVALNNVFFQIREHFFDGYLHSHKGLNHNFQCPIFWTAHLAWLTRIPDIKRRYSEAAALLPFSCRFEGKEVFTDTTPERRVLINTRFSPRNPTAGIFENGLADRRVFFGPLPHMPHAYFFSMRETVNHAWYALRGFHFFEAIVRLALFALESIVMLVPLYSTSYGRIESFTIKEKHASVKVVPASKYGSELKKVVILNIAL